MTHTKIHKMVEELGNMIIPALKGPLTIVGILSGGKYVSTELAEYLVSKGVVCNHFNVKIDLEKGLITSGRELIKPNDSTYLFVDDAVWSSQTKQIIIKEAKDLHIENYKYAVLLDPHRQADFSIYS